MSPLPLIVFYYMGLITKYGRCSFITYLLPDQLVYDGISPV